jgi:hypothetical protein
MPAAAPVMNFGGVLKELEQFQAALFDKASTYTKVIIGLGYGGFFAAWSGTKQHLSPRLVVSSALLVTISLVLFIVYEIYQTTVISLLSIEFSKAVDHNPAELPTAMDTYRVKSRKLIRPMLAVWKYVFAATVATGLGAAGILIYAFIRSLIRM